MKKFQFTEKLSLIFAKRRETNIPYNNNNIACTYLCPIQIIQRPDYKVAWVEGVGWTVRMGWVHSRVGLGSTDEKIHKRKSYFNYKDS